MNVWEKTNLLSEVNKQKFVTILQDSLGHSCKHNHYHAKRTLRGLGLKVSEVNTLLEFFRENGGYCDCEILLNIIYS